MKQTTLLLFLSLFLFACRAADTTATNAQVAANSPAPVSAPATEPALQLQPAVPSTVTAAPTAEPSSTPAATPRPTVTLAGTPSKTGQSITLALVGPPPTLNPITNSAPALRPLIPLLFDSLLRVDPESAQVQPGLALSWQYSVDGRRVTFALPPNLVWGDGTPFTATDVADSLLATQHPALLNFSRITAPDDQTLIVEFLNIDCAAVTTLGLLPLLPANQIRGANPAGSGPFVVIDRPEDGRSLTVARNPYYHGLPPKLDEIRVQFFTEAELEIIVSEGAGRFSAIGPLSQPLVAPDGFSEFTYPAARMVGVAINDAPKNDPPLPGPVRRALLMALDRPAINAELLQGDGQLTPGSLLPTHWAANAALSVPDYNPDEAASLLRRAGLHDSDGDGWLELDGQRLELSLRVDGTRPLQQRLGRLVSSYYRDLGLFSRAESVPRDSVIDDLFTHDFSLAVFSWPILPDPDQRIFWHSDQNEAGVGLNFTSYSNPQLDDLLAQAVSLPGCEPDDRAKIYASIQATLNRERPVDFVLTPNRHLFVAEPLSGVKPGPFAPFTWNAKMWTLKETN